MDRAAAVAELAMERHGTTPSPPAYLIRPAHHKQDKSPRCSMRFTPQHQAIQQHRGDTNADRAVSQIEGRPMQVSDVEIEKVDDRAEANPIEDIAHSAADDKSDRNGKQRIRSATEPIDQDPDNDGRHDRKDQSVDPGAAIEQAKADAAIVGEDEIEERGDG